MTLRILHLSDLHFRATHKDPRKAFNADVITTSMIKSIREIVQSGNTIDIIIITGDVAFSGKKEEYEVAETFCRKLFEVTTLPNNRLFIVPGNHDVDRAYIDEWQFKGIYSFGSQEEINRILSDKDVFTILMRKFHDFNTFANITMGKRLFDTGKFFYTKSLPINKENRMFYLNLFGFNSAIFSGYDGDDRLRLALGLYQIDNAMKQANKEALISIAFFHHPFSCWHPADKVPQNILRSNMDIILHGHSHDPDNVVMHDAVSRALIVGAGTSFENREVENSFSLLEIDPETGDGKVFFYKYLHKHNVWRKNSDVNPDSKDGSFQFLLNAKGTKLIHSSESMIEEREDISRYLSWLLDTCGYIDIRGVVTGSLRIHKFPIEALYIPLNIKTEIAEIAGKKQRQP